MMKAKAQSTLEYALVITVAAFALLGMYAYTKRSMQGEFQRIGDSLAEPYSYLKTDLHEHFEGDSRAVYWKLPGPVDFLRVRAIHNEWRSERKLIPLSEE
jgi:hypothetical protein